MSDETNACDCYVARHASARKIDEALIRGDDPRSIAQLYRIGKSRVYEHKKHLTEPQVPQVVAVAQEPATPAEAAPNSQPTIHSTEVSTEPEKFVERRMESRGMDLGDAKEAPATPETPFITRALPTPQLPPIVGGAYVKAVAVALASITQGVWRASSADSLAKQHGITKVTARNAYAEAVRHLQLNMGDYTARQATSAAYVTQQRDNAKAQSVTALRHAETWRDRENTAQNEAARTTGERRQAALRDAAHFGLLATKYDLSAEKWSAQALAHQRHLDDVLCLRSPGIRATQINLAPSQNSGEDLAAFAGALARKFADRPDILAALDAAAAELESGAETFDVADEAA